MHGNGTTEKEERVTECRLQSGGAQALDSFTFALALCTTQHRQHEDELTLLDF